MMAFQLSPVEQRSRVTSALGKDCESVRSRCGVGAKSVRSRCGVGRAQTEILWALPVAVVIGAVPLVPRWPRWSFGRGAGFLRRSVTHLRRYSRQRAPDGTKHNGLAPRRENWQNRQDLQAVGKDLAKVGHLPMSPTSKPRQISGTRARGPASASPRHRCANRYFDRLRSRDA